MSKEWCLANGFQPWSNSLWIQFDQRKLTAECSLGCKHYIQLYFQVAGQSLESHSLRASVHAASWSLPLGPSVLTAVLWAPLSTQLSCTAVLWASLHSRPTQPSSGPLSSVLPPLQPLLCSSAALQPCHHVTPTELGRALFYRVNSHLLPICL